MKAIRYVGNVAAVLILGWMLLQGFLRVQFAPWATIGLIHFASWFRIEAPEDIEAFAGLLMLIVALIISGAVVWIVNRIAVKKHDRSIVDH